MDSQTDITELIAWLETDETASREARARRLRHLLEAIRLVPSIYSSARPELD